MTDPSVPPPPPAVPTYSESQQYPYSPAPTGARYNPLAIVAFVLVFVASLGAVICGHIALSQIKRTGDAGHGLALAAVILGYIGIGLTILAIVVWVMFVAATGWTGFTSSPYPG